MTKRISNIDVDSFDFTKYSAVCVVHPQLGWVTHMVFCGDCKKAHLAWLVDDGFYSRSGVCALNYRHPEAKTEVDKFALFVQDLESSGIDMSAITYHFVPIEIHESREDINPHQFMEALVPPAPDSMVILLNYLRMQYGDGLTHGTGNRRHAH
jgi:hypothetical protein